MHPMLTLAETLAKKWMVGYRQGSPPRRAWEHPADLVRLLEERPGNFSSAGQVKAKAIAWLHDVLEDGLSEEGEPVGESDLLRYSYALVPYPDGKEGPPSEIPDDACLPPEVVRGVIQLTHRRGETKEDYYRTLSGIDYLPKLVKCVDRVCNLREGSKTFKPARWTRYVNETATYIVPLTASLNQDTSKWLRTLLLDAMALRPSF